MKFFICCQIIYFFILAISILGLLFSSLAQTITLSVWFSRLHPYFNKAQGIGFDVYKIVTTNFFISIAIMLIALIAIFNASCFHEIKEIDFFIFTILLSLGILYSMMYLTGWSFEHYGTKDLIRIGKIAMEKGNTNSSRCYLYLTEGLLGADDFYSNDTKYVTWRSKFVKKAFTTDNYTSKYLCQSVGKPTFAFAIMGTIFSISTVFCIFILFYVLPNIPSCEQKENISSEQVDDLSTSLIP